MRDRTDEVRKVVERYDGFEFVPLRIEDAFDSRWWASVGGRDQIRERDLGVDLSDEGE
jgi:cytoplasmic tRNA 2-thiolation protein 2